MIGWQNMRSWTLQQNPNLANPGGWTANTSWTTSHGTHSLPSSIPPAIYFPAALTQMHA